MKVIVASRGHPELTESANILIIHAMVRLPLLVRSASLNGYLEVAGSLGLDPHAMMRKAGLARSCLEDPETLISMSAVQRLIEASAQQAKVEDFGLRMAATRTLSVVGPVSLLLRQAGTGLKALEIICKYLRLLNESLLTEVECTDDLAIIREEFILGEQVRPRQALEMTVGGMCQILRGLLGPSWRPRAVYFTHRPPRDVRPHRAFFGCMVQFNANFNGIVCSMSDLQRDLPPADTEMANLARRLLDEALVKRRGRAKSDIALQLIAAMLPNGRCTIDRVAGSLGVSRRTLHRWLESEQQTFLSLLNRVRREFALRLLNDSDRSLDEIAAMLGMSSSSAFAHWFKAEFGRSFVQWRRELRSSESGDRQAA